MAIADRETSTRNSFGAGVFTDLAFSERFSLRIGLDYAKEGNKSRADFYQYSSGSRFTLVSFLTENTELSYLRLPVEARFGFQVRESPLRLYAGLGFFAACLLDESYKWTYTMNFAYPSPVFLSETYSNPPRFRQFNAGITGSGGMAYRMERSSLFLECNVSRGLIGVCENFEEMNFETFSIGVMLGVSYRLGK